MLGLPGQTRGCLFDLDGVLTQTAQLHAAAWKQLFDTYLRERAANRGAELRARGADIVVSHVAVLLEAP